MCLIDKTESIFLFHNVVSFYKNSLWSSFWRKDFTHRKKFALQVIFIAPMIVFVDAGEIVVHKVDLDFHAVDLGWFQAPSLDSLLSPPGLTLELLENGIFPEHCSLLLQNKTIQIIFPTCDLYLKFLWTEVLSLVIKALKF